MTTSHQSTDQCYESQDLLQTIICVDPRGNHGAISQRNWIDRDGNHDGGYSSGVGFQINWQRGALSQAGGRNGAFVIEVLTACKAQLEFYNSGKFRCDENTEAINRIESSIQSLRDRQQRRYNEGTLGTHHAAKHQTD